VQLRQITPLHALQSMTYYLKSEYLAPSPLIEGRKEKKTRGQIN